MLEICAMREFDSVCWDIMVCYGLNLMLCMLRMYAYVRLSYCMIGIYAM